MENKKANGFVTFLLVLIILVSVTAVLALYFDIDENDVKGYFNGKPDYSFNEKSTIFIQNEVFNKMKYAYINLDDTSKLCLYGVDKNNGDLLINDIKELSNNKCFENDLFLGELYINKNHMVDVYDINCGLDNSQIKELNIKYNKITSIMCKDTWLSFYNNESIDISYDYQIVN